MPDYSQYGIPRPVEIGREVRLEQRRATNRAALFAIAGVLVLCVCLCVGLFGAYYALAPQFGGNSAAFSLPSFGGPTATPTEAKPTPVPLLKSAKNDAGLRLTVTAYQRPLPAQGIKIPAGQELVLISVRLENTRTTGGPIAYAPEDFKLVSPEGDSFAPDVGSITTGAMLKKGEIDPGKSVTGDLVFYIYSDVNDLFLSWTSADGQTIEFKVTR
jgi:Domain of unknown function (DUF4352)